MSNQPCDGRDLHVSTPVFESLPMGRACGKTVLLKMECFQPVGSFKIRGMGRLCRQYVHDGKSHLVSSSGGNAGFAVAYAGRMLGVAVTVVVPETTPGDVRRRIEQEDARLVVHGAVWDEAHAHALALASDVGGACIPPFDHPTIWEGHATMVDEIAAQCPRPDAVILAVGGGGLLCGVLQGLDQCGWHDVPVVAVETQGTASLAAALTAGKRVDLDRISGIATSLGARRVAQQAFENARNRPVIPWVTTDALAVDACLRFADDHRVLVEPACGAALAAIYSGAGVVRSSRSVLVIVCGGIGVDVGKLLQWRENQRI